MDILRTAWFTSAEDEFRRKYGDTMKREKIRFVSGGTREIELSAGTIEYEDTGGDGPVLALLHGLMMDASLWDEVIADLSADHRCVVPTLPLGAHRRVMPPEHGRRLAKLLPQGQLAEVDDSYTPIPLDQPARLAQVIREFTHASEPVHEPPEPGD
jgi:pimeloyl-ACP methyl ester carboxylesterase